jgi:hypothetical protein
MLSTAFSRTEPIAYFRSCGHRRKGNGRAIVAQGAARVWVWGSSGPIVTLALPKVGTLAECVFALCEMRLRV